MMSSATTRDRRPPLFGGATSSSQDPLRSGPGGASASAGVDLESLEAENDRSIAALGERVGALRGITTGIHGEAESQHRLLDGMSMSMGGMQLTLRATADKMSRVMSEPRQRRLVAVAGGAAVVLFLLYVWLWR